MARMGHTTPNLTLAIYGRQMDRRDGEPERLASLVESPISSSRAVAKHLKGVASGAGQAPMQRAA